MARLEQRGRRLPQILLLVAWVAPGGVAGGGGSASSVLSTVGAPMGSEGNAAASAAPAGAPEGRVASPGPASAPRDDLKIVYTGSLQLVVDSLPAALDK